jgi:PleD family two-component response regulator
MLLTEADKALYAAKQDGRNCVRRAGAILLKEVVA